MSNEELSASQRAALAQQAAADARRAAARHAAARRAEQDARRREVPARRPPALSPKAGIAYRTGATTTVDPARAVLPPQPSVADDGVRRPTPPTGAPTATTPAAAPPQRRVAARPSRPAPPATTIAPLPVYDAPPSAADGERIAAEEGGTRQPDTGAAGAPDRAAAGTPVLPGAPRDATGQTGAVLGPEERIGAVTGSPTSLPPLPQPPTTVVRTAAPVRSDGLMLPAPPRDEAGTARSVTAAPPHDADDRSGAPSLETVDIDVRGALQEVDTDELSGPVAPAATAGAPPLDDADGAVVDGAVVDDATAGEPSAGEPAADLAERPAGDESPTGDKAASEPVTEPVTEPEPAEVSADSPWAPSARTDVDAAPPPATGDRSPGVAGPRDEAQTIELSDAGETPAVDRPWVRAYPPGVPDTYRYPLVPVTRFLDDAAQDFPDTTAVQFLGTDLSFRQLSEQVDRLATAILELGLSAGDRIAIALPWSPQLVVILHAAWRSGMEPVVLDPDAGPEPLADAVAVASPALLVVLDTLYPALSAHRDQLAAVRHVIASGLLDSLPSLRARVQAVRLKVPTVQIPQDDGVLAFRAVLDGGAPTATQADLDVETTTAVSLVRDGSLVSLTHFNLLAGAFQARLWIPDMRAGRETVAVAGSPADPFTLGAGLGLSMLSAATLLLPEPRQGGVARAIDDARPTVFVAPIDQVRRVLAPASKRRDLSSIRVTLSCGVVHDPAVRVAMEQRTGGRLRVTLSAPTVAGMAVAQPVYADPKDGSAGLPVSDCDIRAVDQDWTGVGRLEVRGPQVAGDDWAPLGVIGSVDDLGDVMVVGPVGRVVRHTGGASDPDVLVAVLRRQDGVQDATVHTEPSGTGLLLVVQVIVTDPAVTEGQLAEALTRSAPTQAPPGRWLLTAPQPPVSDVTPPLPEPLPDAGAQPMDADASVAADQLPPADESSADARPVAVTPSADTEPTDSDRADGGPADTGDEAP